jgi:hypothetical protein
MNALVKSEFDKLTPFQQTEFQRILAWHRSTQKDDGMPMDNAYFKMIEWAKRIPEPAPVPEKTEE